ncbi:MAG: hypothetical protein KAR44_02010 [Candidatus Aegiribacteria sp.]|nr:hypothetical protein [Candidatus Aegiribacteria sp.]
MKLSAVLLIFFVVLSIAADIEISGSTSFFSQYSTRDNAWSELPSQFWRWRFNPVLSIYGIPVVASVFVSSEENMQRQNMNRIYISSHPSASSRSGSVLSWISSIGIGASNPYFTNFTLNAAYLSGANFALNPGGFYFAAAGGRNRRGVEPDGDDPGEYERNMYAVQTGLGSPYGSHLHLSMLYGKDVNGSIIEDSTFRVTPSENYVASLDYGSVLFDGGLCIEGEIAGSMFTRDIRSPGINSEEIPQWLLDFSGANVSSGFGWALDLSSSVRFSENMISASFRRVEPGFESMGAPYIRDDEISIETRADKYFIDRQMSAGLWYRWESDNLMNTKSSTSTANTYGVRVGFIFRNFPRIYISYSPSYTDMQDSTTSSFETSMISVSANYRSNIAGLDVNSAAAFSVYDNSAGTGSSDYSSMSAVLRETVTLDFPLVLTACLSTRRSRTGSYPVWTYTGDLRGTWYPSHSLSMTLGGYYTTGDDERKIGAVLNGGFPICDFLTANLSGEYITFSSNIEKDYTNTVGGAGITVVW